MSKTILLNQSDWHFTKENPGIPTAVMGEAVALPHTWNAVDGQDGGNVTTAAPAGIRWHWKSPPSRQAARLFCSWMAQP